MHLSLFQSVTFPLWYHCRQQEHHTLQLGSGRDKGHIPSGCKPAALLWAHYTLSHRFCKTSYYQELQMRRNRNRQTLELAQRGTTCVFIRACYYSSSRDSDTSPERNEGLTLHGIDGGRVYIWGLDTGTRCPCKCWYQALYKAKHISTT